MEQVLLFSSEQPLGGMGSIRHPVNACLDARK
jgi:hypothetical protein